MTYNNMFVRYIIVFTYYVNIPAYEINNYYFIQSAW